jgi:membrane protein DedA with SNARE-associated domain
MHSLALLIIQWLTKFGGSINTLIESLGGLGMLIVAIFDSSFLSLPEGNDLLIVVFSTGQSWGHMAYYVSMTIIGSITGCYLLYSVGRKGGSPILRKRFSQQNVERAERLFNKYGLFTVLIPSILPPPTPFKIFVLSAGVFRLKTWEFLTAVLIGRTIRYAMWGILAVLYGNAVKQFMQHNLNTIGMVLLGVFALAVVATYIVYLRRIKVREAGK